MPDYMNVREVKKVIEASIFNPTMRRDAKDFVDAQETKITELETRIAELEKQLAAKYTLPDSIKEALNSGDGTYRP